MQKHPRPVTDCCLDQQHRTGRKNGRRYQVQEQASRDMLIVARCVCNRRSRSQSIRRFPSKNCHYKSKYQFCGGYCSEHGDICVHAMTTKIQLTKAVRGVYNSAYYTSQWIWNRCRNGMRSARGARSRCEQVTGVGSPQYGTPRSAWYSSLRSYDCTHEIVSVLRIVKWQLVACVALRDCADSYVHDSAPAQLR